MRTDDFNGCTICVLGTLRAVKQQQPNGGENCIFTFHIRVALNDEYWFHGLCSTTWTISMIINPLGAITTILLSYSSRGSCGDQVWMSRGNNWDDYSQKRVKKNKQHMHHADWMQNDCENSSCCSARHMISYDLLIIFLVMYNAIAFYCFT